MFEKVKDQIHLGFRGKVIAFVLILAGVYASIWALAEPLTLKWITDNPGSWRLILLCSTLIITIVAFIFFLPKKVLEKFGADSNDTNLQTSVVSRGNPMITLESDGFQGKVFAVKGNYSKDEMDWNIKPSANRALFATLIYKPTAKIKFYFRLILVSKDKSEQKFVWLRLDSELAVPKRYEGQEEFGYPLHAVNQANYLKTNVDLKKAVQETFGQVGWEYAKTQLFPIRGEGKIKEVSFR